MKDFEIIKKALSSKVKDKEIKETSTFYSFSKKRRQYFRIKRLGL